MVDACDGCDYHSDADANGFVKESQRTTHSIAMSLSPPSQHHQHSAFSIIPTYLNCYRMIVTNVVLLLPLWQSWSVLVISLLLFSCSNDAAMSTAVKEHIVIP